PTCRARCWFSPSSAAWTRPQAPVLCGGEQRHGKHTVVVPAETGPSQERFPAWDRRPSGNAVRSFPFGGLLLSPSWPIRRRSRMSNRNVVLITGASSGIGHATARLLSQRDYKVFGTSRHPASAEPIPTVEMVALDVRADDSVAACVNAVLSRAGRFDVLINNAGYELASASEELSLEEAKAQFETNFFGVVRRQRALNAIRAYEEKAPGPELVAETVLEIIAHERPRLRYVIGRQAKSITRLRRLLPERVYEQGARRNFWLDKHQADTP